jgi:hypothetical protein
MHYRLMKTAQTASAAVPTKLPLACTCYVAMVHHGTAYDSNMLLHLAAYHV